MATRWRGRSRSSSAGLRAGQSRAASCGESIGDALLAPHRSYLPVIRPLLGERLIKGMAHITGGGITDNLPRILPSGTGARRSIAPRGRCRALFHGCRGPAACRTTDMLRTFNMGIGLIVVVRRA